MQASLMIRYRSCSIHVSLIADCHSVLCVFIFVVKYISCMCCT